MEWRDSIHSKLVAWLKIILPLTALALLSTLFLLSQSRTNTGEIPFSQRDLEERARDEVITAPRFSGASAAGDLISFTATSARPDPGQSSLVHATDLVARIDLISGTQIRFDAGSALLNTRTQEAELLGGVSITSSTGYLIESQQLKTRMQEVGAETDGPITGTGPAGRVEAGKMLLTSDPETDDIHLLFTNGVKLLYQPQE